MSTIKLHGCLSDKQSGNPIIRQIKACPARAGVQTMNGRVYDPLLGRFLSPDNYVQMPDYTQNFNRYAYCMNNPLIYTDPSGECLGFIIGGALIFGYLGGAMTEGTFDPTMWRWNEQTWAGIGIGMGAGALAGWGFSALGPAISTTLGPVSEGGIGLFSSFSAHVSGYTIAGGVMGGAAGYATGFGTGMVISHGDWGYAHQSGILGAQIGGTVGSTVGVIYALTSPAGREWMRYMFSNHDEMKLPDYEAPIIDMSNNNEVPTYKTPVYRGSYLEFSGELQYDSKDRAYVDGTLTWKDVYSDGSIVSGKTWQGRSGPYGTRVIPRGLQFLREGSHYSPVPNLSHTYNGVSFFIDIYPNPSIEIHPDGNVLGTEACIGVRASAADLRLLYNSVTRYLGVFNTMLLDVNY